MGKKSRTKGSSGELEMARILSAWFCHDKTMLKAKAEDLPLRRTPLSGGWSGKLAGDLVVVDDRAKGFELLSAEVKRHERWDVGDVLKPSAKVASWMRQAEDAAKKTEAMPVVFARKNLGKWWVLLPRLCWSMSENRTGPLVPPRVVAGKETISLELDFFLGLGPGHWLWVAVEWVRHNGAGGKV
jgi:hypothetical protein